MVLIVALLMSLMLALGLLRRVVEPACPSCEAKSWIPSPNALHCAHCGWSNAAAPAAKAEVPQYELVLNG